MNLNIMRNTSKIIVLTLRTLIIAWLSD